MVAILGRITKIPIAIIHIDPDIGAAAMNAYIHCSKSIEMNCQKKTKLATTHTNWNMKSAAVNMVYAPFCRIVADSSAGCIQSQIKICWIVFNGFISMSKKFKWFFVEFPFGWDMFFLRWGNRLNVKYCDVTYELDDIN